MMQISTNRFYDNTTSLMQQLAQKADTLNTQIATGKKLSAPSDNVASYQRLATIGRASADATAYGANITAAQSVLQQADSAFGAIGNDLQRASELVVQANSGTLSLAQKGSIATELRSIVTDMVSLANTKSSTGTPLFGGTSGDQAVSQDSRGVVSFTDTGASSTIPIGDNDSVQPSEKASRVFGGVTSASGATDMFAMLSNIADALESGSTGTTVTNASNDIAAAVSQISDVRGSVAARAARVDLVASRATDAATAREADRSSLEDTDITAAVTDLQKTMTVLQATQASFTKLSSLSLFDYLR